MNNFPSLRQKYWACPICGDEERSQNDVQGHISACHEKAERNRFGVGSASQLEFEVNKAKILQHEDLSEPGYMKDKNDQVLATIEVEHWATVKSTGPLHENILRAFTEAFDFHLQGIHLFQTTFQICVRKKNKDEMKYFLQREIKKEKKKPRAFIIPASEDGHWFLIRVELEERAIFLVDSRPDIVRPKFEIVKTIRKVMRQLIPGEWRLTSTSGNPRVHNLNDSGVVMCLNLASFALTSPRDSDIGEGFFNVFAYGVDAHFLKRARSYIATVALNKLRGGKDTEALLPVYSPENF